MRARKFPFKHAWDGIKKVTASQVLTKQDADKLVVIDTTTACELTLPPVYPANKGMTFNIKLLQLAGSGAHSVKPHANDKIMASFASSTAAADAKIFYFGTDAAGTGDKIGDIATFVSDGLDGYDVVGQGSFFREA